MDRRIIQIGGIVAIAATSIVLLRRLTGSYASFTSLISSIMGNYFTVSELCYSSTANAKGIDNTPSAEIKARLEKLIKYALNPIRAIYDKPIRVSSGYRCTKLNDAIGGAKNSQHLKGEAADLQPTQGGSLADLAKAVVTWGDYDQMIIEQVNGTKWIHVSWTENPRREILSFNGGNYKTLTKSNYLNAL